MPSKMNIYLCALAFSAFLFVACNRNDKSNSRTPSSYSLDNSQEPYPRPYNRSDNHGLGADSAERHAVNAPDAKSTTTVEQSKPTQTEDVQKTAQKQSVKTVLSEYYQEGYDRGYDDGEDDAVMGQGIDAQFDDDCEYKGWKRKDYQEGYQDGYEAGYYDNAEYDD